MSVVPRFATGQVVEEIVARVNGQIITLSEFLRSKDQLRDDVKQQDPSECGQSCSASGKKTSCAI